MSYIKKAGDALLIIVGIYAAVFIVWFALMAGCVESGNECGGDALTNMVRATHGPVLKALGVVE